VSDRVSRILLVEDDEDLAAGIRDNLLAEGYRARVVHDGDSGLHMAMQQRFDLILLDVMLPGMDGFEVCRRLRANGSNVPVLFLTARSGRDDRIRGLREGGDDYLTKPFDLQEMLARVAAVALLRHRSPRSGARTYPQGSADPEVPGRPRRAGRDAGSDSRPRLG